MSWGAGQRVLLDPHPASAHAEDSKMESVDSDEGSSNAPKRKAAPPKKAPRKTAKEQK